jgi:hypothetical protein
LVFASVLAQEFAKDKGSIIIDDETIRPDTITNPSFQSPMQEGGIRAVSAGSPVPTLGKGVLQNFSRRNQTPVSLSEMRTGGRVIVVLHRRIDRIVRHGSWTAFYKHYPNSTGLTQLSLPGYSRDRSKAVVLLSNQRQGRWGHGSLWILAKDHGKWRVTGTLGLWRS